MDVPDPQGRQVPQRQDADRPGRRGESEAVRHREGLECGPVAVLRRFRRLGPRSIHGRRSAQVADRRVPLPAQPDDLPGDHPAGRDRGKARDLGEERHDRDGTVPAPQVRRQAERRARPKPQLLGRPRTARGSPGHVLPGKRAAGARAACGADRPRDAAVAAGGATLQEQLEVHLLLRADREPPAGLHANGRGAVPGCAGASCGRARDQPPPANPARDARRGADRQRQPVLAGLRLQRPHHAAA